MVKVRLLVACATLLAVALPGTASAGRFGGVVVAKQLQRGTLVVVGRGGIAVTVRGPAAHARLGDRVTLEGVRLDDRTIEMSRLRVVGHTRHATIHGVVVRTLARGTLVSTGNSVILILPRRPRALASAADHGELRAGAVARFRVRIDDDDLLEEAPAIRLGQAATIRIEGTIVSVAPLIVSLEGLPLTITVPAGMTLPTTLGVGRRIEFDVRVGAGNVFTLVAIDEIENANIQAEDEEIELKGFVVNSTASQLVVRRRDATFTFAAPTGLTLPTLPTGTFVEVRGVRVHGVLTLERLRVEDEGDSGGGSGGGGGDGSGHSGSGH